ncbi:MAG: hypothetical protein JST85_13845 [Acidobacteria bacterium]|nr:hypothetical protein [Acidobacteriota bacterium]
MSKRILMYEGIGPSVNDARRIAKKHEGITVLETYGENIIVEGAFPLVEDLMSELPGWRLTTVRRIKHPDNRVHVKRP